MTEHEQVTLEIHIARTTAQRAEQTIAAEGWEPEEGWRLLVACGLYVLEIERVLQDIREGRTGPEALADLLAKGLRMESRLASLRFRAFELQQALQNWNLSSGAVRTTWETLPAECCRREAEVAALRAELEQLRAELAGLVE